MPGLCAVVPPSNSSADSVIDGLLGRMTHFPWQRSTRHLDAKSGAAFGVVAVEPSSGLSPRIAHRGNSVLVLDGEIYGSSDQAADLLREWRRDGTESLKPIHGMFSAVVWEADTRELTIITDRFGMRPVYVATAGHSFVVASEIDALAAVDGVDCDWSETGVAQFFAFGHFFNDDTLLRGVRAIGPATAATWRAAAGRLEEVRYWRPSSSGSSETGHSSAERLEHALVAAVARRAGEGECLGLSLSSGLDARTILGLVPSGRNLKSVSIGIAGGIDHRGASRLAALAGVPHHAYVLDDAFLGRFEEHLRSMVALTDGHYLDQGIVMPTLPTYRDLGIDFLLRGHGGELLHMRKAYAFSMDDEGLNASESGIERWLWSHLTDYMLSGVPRDLFTFDIDALGRESLARALAQSGDVNTPVDRAWHLFLNERLHRETALSMQLFGNFNTVRMPFIDNDVVDALLALPARMKLGDELQTRILRNQRPDFLTVVNANTGARMGAGPLAVKAASLRLRVGAKIGLPGYQPYERLGLWLRRELRPFVERTLLRDEFLDRGPFRADVVRRTVAQHMANEANHTFLLMALVVFAEERLRAVAAARISLA